MALLQGDAARIIQIGCRYGGLGEEIVDRQGAIAVNAKGDEAAAPEQGNYSPHHRDYVTQQGRFRCEDPAESRLNRYLYCGNDPVNRIDPGGLEESDLFGEPPLSPERVLDSLQALNPIEYEYLAAVGATIKLRNRPDRWADADYEVESDPVSGRKSVVVLSRDISQYRAYLLTASLVRRLPGFAEFEKKRMRELGIDPHNAGVEPATPEYRRKKAAESEERLRRFMIRAGATDEEVASEENIQALARRFGPGGSLEQALIVAGPAAAVGAARFNQGVAAAERGMAARVGETTPSSLVAPGVGTSRVIRGGSTNAPLLPRPNHPHAHGFTVRDVNPSGNRLNCAECSVIVDNLLGGAPKGTPLWTAKEASDTLDLGRLEAIYRAEFSELQYNVAEITAELQATGPGARGIVFGIEEGAIEGHYFNVVNQSGQIRYLCGQAGGEIDPSRFVAFRLLRTK